MSSAPTAAEPHGFSGILVQQPAALLLPGAQRRCLLLIEDLKSSIHKGQVT